MKNLGYRKCLQLYELLEIGYQIFRSRVTHVKKVRTQHVEGIHKKKAEAVNQIGANSCPKCGGELITRKVNMEILKGVTII
ncbi:MAG: hypothetical protein NHB14_13275 [Desulfosporosinus sp.]|nr:hypothetical protein [Desulfosporosinus sp.]